MFLLSYVTEILWNTVICKTTKMSYGHTFCIMTYFSHFNHTFVWAGPFWTSKRGEFVMVLWEGWRVSHSVKKRVCRRKKNGKDCKTHEVAVYAKLPNAVSDCCQLNKEKQWHSIAIYFLWIPMHFTVSSFRGSSSKVSQFPSWTVLENFWRFPDKAHSKTCFTAYWCGHFFFFWRHFGCFHTR